MTTKQKDTCCIVARDGGAQSGGGTQPVTTELRESKASCEKVAIPGGMGLVGTNKPALELDGEAPATKKKIAPFKMDACTVTNERFAAFVEETGYVTDAERIGDSFVFYSLLEPELREGPVFEAAPWWRIVKGAFWKMPYGPGGKEGLPPDHPVVHVTWNDATAFAAWAGGALPSEAQWEHAARGGYLDVRFPWGDEEPNDHDFFPCNIWQGRFPERNLVLDGYLGTAPAQSFEPNGYGLYNMVGNVWEWTCDPFKVKSLKKSVRAAHAGKEGYKLSKGGSFLCHASYCYRYRIAARTASSPDSSASHQGFRLVYPADE